MTPRPKKPRTIRVPLTCEADRMLRELVDYAIRERLLRPSARDKVGSIVRAAITQFHRAFFVGAGRDGSTEGGGDAQA